MIELIAIISIFSLGGYIISTEGHILEKPRDIIAKYIFGAKIYFKDGDRTTKKRKTDVQTKETDFPNKVTEYLWKPVWGCPICMVSVWGAVVYTFLSQWDINSAWHFTMCIISAACINFIVFKNLVEEKLS